MRLTRADKENIYINKMTELQQRWKNPIDNKWDFSEWTDKQLDQGLEDTIGQLKFEKALFVIKGLAYTLIILGIIWIFR